MATRTRMRLRRRATARTMMAMIARVAARSQHRVAMTAVTTIMTTMMLTAAALLAWMMTMTTLIATHGAPSVQVQAGRAQAPVQAEALAEAEAEARRDERLRLPPLPLLRVAPAQLLRQPEVCHRRLLARRQALAQAVELRAHLARAVEAVPQPQPLPYGRFPWGLQFRARRQLLLLRPRLRLQLHHLLVQQAVQQAQASLPSLLDVHSTTRMRTWGATRATACERPGPGARGEDAAGRPLPLSCGMWGPPGGG